MMLTNVRTLFVLSYVFRKRLIFNCPGSPRAKPNSYQHYHHFKLPLSLLQITIFEHTKTVRFLCGFITFVLNILKQNHMRNIYTPNLLTHSSESLHQGNMCIIK